MVFALLDPFQGPLCGIQLGKNLMEQAPLPSAGDTESAKRYFIAGMAYWVHNYGLSALRNLTSSITSSVLNKVISLIFSKSESLASTTSFMRPVKRFVNGEAAQIQQ
jgi:hypothetical protein